MRRQDYIWLAVDADAYELPIAVADTAEELANILGVTRNTVLVTALRGHNGAISGRRIYKLRKEISDEI